VNILVLLFMTGVALLFLAQFAAAWRSTRKLQGKLDTGIDTGYIRMEDFFGVRLRALAGADQVVTGNWACAPGLASWGERHVRGSVNAGDGATLDSLAVDGSLTLGRSVTVLGWLDSHGAVQVGEGSRVAGRLTSAASVTLGPRCRLKTVFAPLVSTPPDNHTPAPAVTARALLSLESSADDWHALSLDWARVVRTGAATIAYQGDFRPTAPVELLMKLVVHGHLYLPAGSLAKGDIRASGSLTLGARCEMAGNATAGGDLTVGANGIFHQTLHAGRDLELGNGVQSGPAGVSPVNTWTAACAGRRLRVGAGVGVRGKLTAGEMIETG